MILLQQPIDHSIFWGITPSDLLTALIAPLLFFLVGFAVGEIKEIRRKKKIKEDEIELKKIIIEWLIKIQERLLQQHRTMQSIIEGYINDDFRINMDMVIIPIDRLLSIPDLELRKVIKGEQYYIEIISNLSYVRNSQDDIKELFKEREKTTLDLDHERRSLNRTGFNMALKLYTSMLLEEGNEKYDSIWDGLVQSKERQDIIDFSGVKFHNDFLLVIYDYLFEKINYDNIDEEDEDYEDEDSNWAKLMELNGFLDDYTLYLDKDANLKSNFINSLEYQKNQFGNMAETIGKFLETVK